MSRVSDSLHGPARGPRAVAPAADRHVALAEVDRALAAIEDDIVRHDYEILQLERAGEDTARAREALAALQARHAATRDRRAGLLAG